MCWNADRNVQLQSRRSRHYRVVVHVKHALEKSNYYRIFTSKVITSLESSCMFQCNRLEMSRTFWRWSRLHVLLWPRNNHVTKVDDSKCQRPQTFYINTFAADEYLARLLENAHRVFQMNVRNKSCYATVRTFNNCSAMKKEMMLLVSRII